MTRTYLPPRQRLHALLDVVALFVVLGALFLILRACT
jgi:hypothetical protein